MHVRRPTAAASALAGLLACGPATAQFKDPDDATDYRQGVMTVMSHHIGAVAQRVDGRLPFDARAVQSDAEILATLSRLPWVAFVPGSDEGQTSAGPEVWSQPDRFKAAAQRLQDTAARLAEIARGGDQGAIKAAAGAVGDSCKSCHDVFRKRR